MPQERLSLRENYKRISAYLSGAHRRSVPVFLKIHVDFLASQELKHNVRDFRIEL